MRSEFKTAIQNPQKASQYLSNKIYNITNNTLFENYLQYRYEPPTNQLTQEWDHLMIMDACRYEEFKEMSNFSADLDYIISPSSSTKSWLERAVGEQTFYDTVYISANPRTHRYADQFHKMIHVWDWGFDENLKVAPPAPVAKAAVKAANEYPKKEL